MKIRIAINGFGRIGRNLFRLLLNHPEIEVVAINDIAETKTMAHLVKYDSIHGVLPFKVDSDDKGIMINGQQFLFFHEKRDINAPGSISLSSYYNHPNRSWAGIVLKL